MDALLLLFVRPLVSAIAILAQMRCMQLGSIQALIQVWVFATWADKTCKVATLCKSDSCRLNACLQGQLRGNYAKPVTKDGSSGRRSRVMTPHKLLTTLLSAVAGQNICGNILFARQVTSLEAQFGELL